ncbi:MAG: translation elongation factor Ts [Planctomycetes bacterium]|nr:translation elongation factor Ts [Planctomycetota bacterium]MBU4399854.1 translation elongation factor Ts [Planctomycetota bacterium]MCG2683526.1 translation elongation factor Ts [Planctomycetales bacterium]
MPEITAAAVKTLRQKTGLPMMDCKKALQEVAGDIDKAVELLRISGAKLMEKRAGRATTSGRIAIYIGPEQGRAAMADLRCESAPVAVNGEFIQLADDLARQLATGPGAATAEELLAQPSPSGKAATLQQQFDDLVNRIREVFRLERIVRLDGPAGGYAHHNAAAGVLLQFEGEGGELPRDICMHVAALRPQVLRREELDPSEVEKEREILAEMSRKEGKPENIVAKMVEGRMREFYAARCLEDQPIANEMKFGKKTVGQVAKEAGMKLKRFVHWELPKE